MLVCVCIEKWKDALLTICCLLLLFCFVFQIWYCKCSNCNHVHIYSHILGQMQKSNKWKDAAKSKIWTRKKSHWAGWRGLYVYVRILVIEIRIYRYARSLNKNKQTKQITWMNVCIRLAKSIIVCAFKQLRCWCSICWVNKCMWALYFT